MASPELLTDPATRGVIRLIGGPGTGKTTLLVDAAAAHIAAGARAESVLLLCPTTRAAVRTLPPRAAIDRAEPMELIAMLDGLERAGWVVASAHVATTGACGVRLALLARLLAALVPGEAPPRVNRLVTGLPGLESAAPVEALEFLVRGAGVTDPETGVTFPHLNAKDGELNQTNLILPEPCAFLSRNLPPCSVVRPTLDSLARLDYPNYIVQVVDNNTTDPSMWRPLELICQQLGPKFQFMHLEDWPGYKSGALNYALGGLDVTGPVTRTESRACNRIRAAKSRSRARISPRSAYCAPVSIAAARAPRAEWCFPQ